VTTPRKKAATLVCGCEVRVPPSVIEQWLDDSATLVHCGQHGPQRIKSADGPESLANLFRL
jgi:hypothetical protein